MAPKRSMRAPEFENDMARVISSLKRAFPLLTAPERPSKFPRGKLTQHPPLDDDQLASAAGKLGVRLPAEYRDLLAAYGPFELAPEDRDDLERAAFLPPDAAVSQRKPLHAYLEKLLGWVPDHELRAIIERPESDLLPALLTCDANSHPGWLFYVRGEEPLYLAHEKDGLEISEQDLEEALVQQVCNFARWDLRTGDWWKD
jgi:hypothetical protein